MFKTFRLILALLLVPIGSVVAVTSSYWVGRTFPGFFVMANRVVPSVGLSDWSGVKDGNFYQATVVVVGGQPVETSAEIYASVARTEPGTPVTYTLARGGKLYDRTVPSMRFSLYDYVVVFAAYLLNGAAYALIAIYAALGAERQISYALFSLGFAAGLFAFTGVDLYYPHHFFRLHVLAEALFPAALVHMGLVFPRNWLRDSGGFALIPYFVTLPLVAAYEMVLFDPAAYSTVHNASIVYLGLAGCFFLGALGYGYLTETSPERKQPIGLVTFGALVALGPPAVFMGMSGLGGGSVPVNFCAYTAFLFPLSLAYVCLRYRIAVHGSLWQEGAVAVAGRSG